MQWIILSIIVILALVFASRSKLVSILANSVNTVFFVSFAISIISLFYQAPFVYVAEFSLERNGTLESIRKLDSKTGVGAVKEAGKSIVDSISDFFSQKKNESGSQVVSSKELGLIEKEIYPGLVRFVAGFLRIVTVFISIFVMVVSIYLSYTVSGQKEIEELKRRVSELEARNLR